MGIWNGIVQVILFILVVGATAQAGSYEGRNQWNSLGYCSRVYSMPYVLLWYLEFDNLGLYPGHKESKWIV